jgi:NAD(P)-dependent dehydrogenase (short-subunit alcohol dehydrogenase family)/3-oxoacyl-(acyl-carrier-protein) synthase
MKDLNGKVALVTGGAKGVGRAVVRELAARGAAVVLNYFHSHEQAKKTRDELVAEGADVTLVRASVVRQDQVDRMFAEVVRLHGGLDILINNAADGALLPVAEVTDADLDRAIETNYKGGLRCARAAAPLMARRGGGAIVYVSALGGSQMVMANYLACAPAKAAAEATARYLAVELAPSNIRVNTASAAMLSSEVAGKFPDAEEMQEVIARATPFGRLGTPEEFATVVAFLASDDARWITGQVVLADGGLTLGAALLSPPRAQAAQTSPRRAEPARTAEAVTAPADVPGAEPAPIAEPAPVAKPAPVAAASRPALEAVREPAPEAAQYDDDAIAVVGMGLAVAGANSPEEYWKLRTTGDELFVKVPRDRWPHEHFHAEDPAEEDKAYADACVFVTGFEPVPGALDGMDGDSDDQELTTQWLRHSLVQALDGVGRRPDDACSFVVGYTPDGSQHLEEAGVFSSMTRMTHAIVDGLDLPAGERTALSQGIDASLSHRYRRGARTPSRFLPHRVGELAMRGILPVSTELHMVDTACSSSLYAVDIAAKGLLMGKQDIAVCGGAFALAPRGTVLFSKLQGLSKTGTVHALDEAADGVIFADGAALVVLKRLSRARADGDRVLGVLRAFGSSSDGKGKAIYAPASAGQSLAVRRALEGGGIDAGQVEWINAHATGTPAGDLAEFTTLREHYGNGLPATVTSNKSLIGHTGWAAGVVSLIENLMGFEQRTIPGQYRLSTPRVDFRLDETGLDITSESRPWPDREDTPRLAAVSGFGFGGTNAHLIVSDRPAPAPVGTRAAGGDTAGATTATRTPDTSSRVAIVAWSAYVPGLDGHEEVSRWLAGGPPPLDTFGAQYPAPPFSMVRLPPKTIRALDRCQLMILQCGHQLRERVADFWAERTAKTGVFVGHMGPTRAAMLYANRCYLDDVEHALAGLAHDGSPAVPRVLERLRAEVRGMIPASNEDAFPGQMPNIISARVANYFDLNGPNMTMDSGFASALSSITSASRYLRTGELDFALAGGINGNNLPEYRELIGELLPGADTQLAEGAFLFALTTEELALRAGLPVLAYVDEASADEASAAGASAAGASADQAGTPGAGRDVLRHTASTAENGRYLGAAGGLAVLKALHGAAGTVVVTADDSPAAAGAGLRLTIPGPGGEEPSAREASGGRRPSQPAALPEQFTSATRTKDGSPLLVRRMVPALRETPSRTAGPRLPFLPDGAVVVTDIPGRLAAAADPGARLTVLSTVPLDTARPGWHHLERVTADTVRAALAGRDTAPTRLRVVSALGGATGSGQAPVGEVPALLALHTAAFLVLQQAYDSLAGADSSVVMLFPGAVDDGVPHAFSGLFTGLLKTAGLELEQATAFALLTATPDLAAAITAAERESGLARDFPVVVDDGGIRKTYRLTEEDGAPRPDTPAVLDRDSVVVVAGGARGITAEVVKAVAEHFGPRLYVLGSNALDSYPPETFAGTDAEFAAGKARFISSRLAAGKGGGVTVASISKEFERMLNARAARRNLDTMEAHSGKGRVTYLTCDMRDQAAVDAAIGRILRENDRIDLLVNSAGLQRSALVKDKDVAEFTAIRDLKVASYLNLRRALRGREPRLWCNFGSLLGYFGQRGEADYASANDFLATASQYASVREGREEFTVGWTLWSEVGMGADELTKAYYQRAGSYSGMPVAEGVHHFIQELHAPVRRPSVVHLGEAERATVERFYPGYQTGGPDGTEQGAGAAPSEGFYLRRLVESDAKSALFECRFDLDTDAYLEHHTVRGAPTLPGTFVTELAAEAARHLVPGRHVVAFEDLRFEHFLRVYRDVPPQPKRIRAEIASAQGDVTEVQVSITEDVVAPTGTVLIKDRLHFSARVLLADSFPAAPRWERWDDAEDTPVPDPYHLPGAPVRLTGPFVSTTDTRIHPLGKRGRYALTLPEDGPWERFTVPSILLDGLARVGVLDLVGGELIPVAAPLSIRRIDLYEDTNDRALSREPGGLDLYVTPAGSDLAAEPADNRFVAVRPDGRMVLQMKDLRAVRIGFVHAVTGEAVEPEAVLAEAVEPEAVQPEPVESGPVQPEPALA